MKLIIYDMADGYPLDGSMPNFLCLLVNEAGEITKP